MSDDRLHVFEVEAEYPDGEVERLTFYAPDEATARRYAASWAARLGASVAVRVVSDSGERHGVTPKERA